MTKLLQQLREFKQLLKKAQKKFKFEALEKPNENGALGFSVKVRIYKVISVTSIKTIIVGSFFRITEARKVKDIIEKYSIRRYKESFEVKIIPEEYQLRHFHLENMLGI